MSKVTGRAAAASIRGLSLSWHSASSCADDAWSAMRLKCPSRPSLLENSWPKSSSKAPSASTVSTFYRQQQRTISYLEPGTTPYLGDHVPRCLLSCPRSVARTSVAQSALPAASRSLRSSVSRIFFRAIHSETSASGRNFPYMSSYACTEKNSEWGLDLHGIKPHTCGLMVPITVEDGCISLRAFVSPSGIRCRCRRHQRLWD